MAWLPPAIISKGEFKTIHQQFYFLTLILLAFIIPLHQQWTSIFIVILVVTWIFEKGWVDRIKKAFSRKCTFLFAGYYLLHVIGMLYSENMAFGLFDLQIKLSLLLLPIIIGGIYVPEYWQRKILLSFILGCIASLSICMGFAIYKYLIYAEFNFTYIKLAGILMHPGYLSLSFNIALIVLYYSFINSGFLKWKKVFKIILIAIFSVFLFLLSARIGIIVFFLNMTFFLIIFSIKKKSIYPALLILIMSTVTFFFIKKTPEVSKRWEQLSLTLTENSTKFFNKNSNEVIEQAGSSDIRLYIWKASWEIIKREPFLGVGTGDVKDELLAAYEENSITHAINLNLNAHNQFVQTTVALGLAGLLCLFLSLLLPLIYAIKTRKFIYSFFLITMIAYLMADSFLEVQAGVVIYGFFNALFYFHSEIIKKQTT